MVNMSFVLKLNTTITSVECIFPDSFVLRFTGKGDFQKVVEFDFKVYKYRILPDGCTVDVTGYGLDTDTFPASADILDMCKTYGVCWAEVYIHCSKDPDSGKVVELVGMYDTTISNENYKYFLPDYKFSIPNGKCMSTEQVKWMNQIMWDVTGFCTAHMFHDSEDLVRVYESNGGVYLRTTSGECACYDIVKDSVKFTGDAICKSASSQVKRVFLEGRTKDVILDIIRKLSKAIPFPVNSVTIPSTGGSRGCYFPSKRESGAFDIVIE